MGTPEGAGAAPRLADRSHRPGAGKEEARAGRWRRAEAARGRLLAGRRAEGRRSPGLTGGERCGEKEPRAEGVDQAQGWHCCVSLFACSFSCEALRLLWLRGHWCGGRGATAESILWDTSKPPQLRGRIDTARVTANSSWSNCSSPLQGQRHQILLEICCRCLLHLLFYLYLYEGRQGLHRF